MISTGRRCADGLIDPRALLRRSGDGPLSRLVSGLPEHDLAPCANARAAIRQAADRLGLEPGDEVLFPAWNCGSEADPLLAAGLSLRLYPVDGDGRVRAAELAARIGPTTRAVYLTHYLGPLQPEAAAIAALCRARRLALIEDAALALLTPGAGAWGDASIFSFQKFFPLAGGGALALRRDLAPPRFDRPFPSRLEARILAREVLRRLLGPGRAAALGARRRRAAQIPGANSGPAPRDDLPDIPAHYIFDPAFRDAGPSRTTRRALGGLDAGAAATARRRNHALLVEALPGLSPATQPLLPVLPEGAVPVVFPLRIPGDRRDAVCAALQAQGIAASPWWAGYHRGLDWSDPALVPVRRLKDEVLALPLAQHLSPRQLRWMAGRVAAELDAPPGVQDADHGAGGTPGPAAGGAPERAGPGEGAPGRADPDAVPRRNAGPG